MLKVWGRRDSSNLQKVVWCLGELEIPFERVDWGGKFGGNNEPSYLARNPNGRVPTIEDNGFILWESNSIVRYLVEKYGNGRLLPATVEARANANRWMDWQQITLNRSMVTLYQGMVRRSDVHTDAKATEQALAEAGRMWGIVEHYLKDLYLAGNEFSMGDIPLGVWANRWFNMPVERPNLPRLAAWYERLRERPPYQTHIMIPLS